MKFVSIPYNDFIYEIFIYEMLCEIFVRACIRDELKPKFIEALLLGKEIIILGDMNCNLLKTSCYESKILLDTCSELHMT